MKKSTSNLGAAVLAGLVAALALSIVCSVQWGMKLSGTEHWILALLPVTGGGLVAGSRFSRSGITAGLIVGLTSVLIGLTSFAYFMAHPNLLPPGRQTPWLVHLLLMQLWDLPCGAFGGYLGARYFGLSEVDK